RHQAARARQFYRAAREAFPTADARSLVAAEIMGRIYPAALDELAARGDRGARVPRVRGAHHPADRPQDRDRAPLLGGGPVRPRRIAPRARCVKAAVYRGAAGLAAEDWPEPAIGPGEVLLRLKGCGLCGSDIAKLGDPATKI